MRGAFMAPSRRAAMTSPKHRLRQAVRTIRDVVANFGGHEQSAPHAKHYEGSGQLASPALKTLYDKLVQYDDKLIGQTTEDISLFDRFILIELGARGRDDFTEVIAIESLPSGGYRVDVREHEGRGKHVRSTYKDIASPYGVILFIELAISEYLAASQVQDPSEPVDPHLEP